MKKIFRMAISILLLIGFISCSAQMDNFYVPFSKPLNYNLDTLSYEDLTDYDIFTYIQDDYLDLIAVIPLTEDYYKITDSWSDIQSLIEKLSIIGKTSNIKPKTMMTKTSSELNSLAISSSTVLTVDDIVAFNELKLYIEDLSGMISINKTLLFGSNLGRSLTTDEIVSLTTLQLLYNRIVEYHGEINLESMTYDEIEILLLSLPIVPNEEELTQFSSGLALLQSLIQ